MAGSKEIRNKIKSVQSTRKITKAMEMVSASKMKKAQDRMRASRPYVETRAADRDARRQGEHRVQASVPRAARDGASASARSSSPPTRASAAASTPTCCASCCTQHKEWRAKGIEVDYVAIGSKGVGLPAAGSARTSSRSAVQLGDRPHLDKLVGPVKVLLDKYVDGDARRGAHLLHDVRQHDEAGSRGTAGCCRFPSSSARRPARCARPRSQTASWDYLYEPDAQRAPRRRAAPLHRGARLPDGEREHGLRAVGADGRDEGRLGQRRRRSSTSCSSSTTRRGRRRSPRNWRRSSAARRRSERAIASQRIES